MAKILIVDDSATCRRILRKILETIGHQIVEAENEFIALEFYFLEKPDLVFLDLFLDKYYGLDLLENLRKINQEVQVIVASADEQNSTKGAVETAKVQAFIAKPFTVKSVVETVNKVLGSTHN